MAPDLPGHGVTPGPRDGLDVPGLARALGEFLDVLIPTTSAGMTVTRPQVTLIANSLGCQVVAALVEQEPDRACSLVFIGPTLDPATRDAFWSTALRASVCEPFSLLPILVWDYLRFGPRRFLATCRYALADDITLRLPGVRVPTLVIQGRRDHIVTMPWATHVAGLVPAGRLAVVEDGAHAVHFSRATRVASLIRGFLAGANA